jgi:t-SNARE complex subunit (syntaxin)
MATDKRERQRANRGEKKAEEAKAAKRRSRIDMAKRWALYAVIFIIAIFVLWLISN